MKRKIQQLLCNWKQKKKRKPLILRGVRQAGKTYILQEFGKHEFSNCHYLNFEKNAELTTIFEPNLEPKRIINEISFLKDKAIDTKNDLLIFDEIQACPKALTSLKYFCEELPEMALCAAGSLLGIHLNSNSYPVGKVDMLNLFPMSFEEFLLGIDDEKSIYALEKLDLSSPIPEIIHQHLWQQLKLYFIIGGLPEAINTYKENKDNLYIALQQVREKQITLIKAYYADMAKHSGKVNAMHLDRLWRAVPTQLAQQQNGTAAKFKFKNIIPNINRYSRLVNTIDWLDHAGLIIKAPIAHKAALPLSAYTKENTFKLFMFDVGILGAMSGLSPKTIIKYDYGTYKGYFAENFVAQEFLSSGVEQIVSWQEGSAEIEFLRDIGGKLLPVEVKSGHITQAKSLKAFGEKYKPEYKTIFSAKNLYINTDTEQHFYPLYLAGKFPLQ